MEFLSGLFLLQYLIVLITFCRESAFWYTLAQSAVPQKFIYVSKNRSSFSRVSLKSETKDARP